MSVRMKLDQSGVKLSLKQWNRIPPAGRRQLVERPCNTEAQAEAFKQYLTSQIKTYTGTSVEYTTVDAARAWADTGLVPDRIRDWANGLGLAPPTADQ
jgi:hypothetical protein